MDPTECTNIKTSIYTLDCNVYVPKLMQALQTPGICLCRCIIVCFPTDLI